MQKQAFLGSFSTRSHTAEMRWAGVQRNKSPVVGRASTTRITSKDSHLLSPRRSAFTTIHRDACPGVACAERTERTETLQLWIQQPIHHRVIPRALKFVNSSSDGRVRAAVSLFVCCVSYCVLHGASSPRR
jgi:hypothetical protein